MADAVLLNTRQYAECFGFRGGIIDPDDDFIFRAPRVERRGDISNLGGQEQIIDTQLELALFSYYATSRINIRPVQADAILPANNPKLADLKLGAAVFQEIQILRFLGNTAAVGRHEGVLKFITDRGNVTRAEAEAFYRNGIRALISETVDEEFNKIGFLLRNVISSTDNSFNVVLTRNPQNGHYILRYESRTRNINEELTAQSLEALLSAMSKSGDFSQDAINFVRTQAAQVPMAALSDAALNEVKTILTNFYTNPSTATYNALKDVYVLFVRTSYNPRNNNDIFKHTSSSYSNVLKSLNDGLAQKVFDDYRQSSEIAVLTREQQQRLVQLR